jgi:long-chain acyl-CoA synthetase
MNGADTLPLLLARNASRWPRRPAWRHKRLGIWETETWSAFVRRCHDIAAGLAANGFGRGDRLAVLGDNRPALYATLLAAQSLGGVGVPLDPDADASRLAAVMDDARISIVVADTADQAERLASLTDAQGSPARVFCADTGGFNRSDRWESGRLDTVTNTPQDSATAALEPAPRDLALLLYPAAAQSPPLPLSHAQLITAAEAIAAADPVRPTDEALCYLPMSSYEDALYSLTLGLLGGFACNCPEAPDSVLRDLREIGPTILFLPTAACDALAEIVSSKVEAATGFKRRSFTFFQHLALEAEARREQERALPLGLALGCRIGELVAYAPARDQLGLSRVRWVHTDGPLPPGTARLLRALGVALRPADVRATAPELAQETIETLHA